MWIVCSGTHVGSPETALVLAFVRGLEQSPDMVRSFYRRNKTLQRGAQMQPLLTVPMKVVFVA